MAQRDNTAKLAKALWSFESLKLEPAHFQSEFDSIYFVADGIATFWQLGGAANDYMRAHPGSINVPPELALSLLASRMMDARIIGLKLLVRCSSDLAFISDSICHALESKRQSEMYGGLCELSNLLHRCPPPAAIPVSELLLRLDRLRLSKDVYVRESVERLTELLKEY